MLLTKKHLRCATATVQKEKATAHSDKVEQLLADQLQRMKLAKSQVASISFSQIHCKARSLATCTKVPSP
jgi:hypothetical protein